MIKGIFFSLGNKWPMWLLIGSLLFLAVDDDSTDTEHWNVCNCAAHAGSYVFELSRPCSYSLEAK
jgi:hypothetical protein